MMTINEIFQREELSTRASNICRRNEIFSIIDLKNFFHKNKSFNKLQFCGEKSAKELFNLYEKYKNQDNSRLNKSKKQSFDSVILNLTKEQKEAISNFIETRTNLLSQRSKNVILEYLEQDLKIENFAGKILLQGDFDVNSLKNSGRKTASELRTYILNIRNFILELNKIKEEQGAVFLSNDFLLKSIFPSLERPQEDLKTDSIFSIVDFLLNVNKIFNEDETTIVKKGLKLFKNQEELDLTEIAKEVNLSRERVRQVRNYCLDDLFSKLTFVSNFNDDLLMNYNFNTEADCIEIDTTIVEKINHLNRTSFSKEFITYILSAYLKNSFEQVGDSNNVMEMPGHCSSKKHKWNNIYIVKKEITSEIDFNSLTNDVFKRLSAKIANSYTIDFKSYLSLFLINGNDNILDVAFPVVKKILKDEFEISIDKENNIVFNRNTRKLSHEYAYEALEEIGDIAKVSDITAKIKELYPSFETNEDKVRASLKRDNGFVPIGRESVFGLIKWEYEKDDFKGGTIRENVKKYLLSKKRPIHIYELYEYISKFRPDTYSRSILDSLKSEGSGDFIFFKQSFVGLLEHKDHYDLEKFENLPRQLGKKMISLNEKGKSIDEIILIFKDTYKLEEKDSKSIMYNLEHFNKQYQPFK